MTTSFSLTRTQIANRVLSKVIKTPSPISADSDIVYQAIDLRLKEMHKLGTFWRKVTSVPVTFSVSSSIATASAGAGDILYPIKVTFKNGDFDEPVYIIGPDEYAAIPDKTKATNLPEKVLWKGGSEFIFYPVPNANGTAKLLYEKIADDTSAGAAIDVDVAMIRPMIDIIKYDIADDYGIPEGTQVRWRAEALKAEKDIKKLGALRTDYLPVKVDDFDSVQPNSRRPSDY